jgi:outer membrane protein assembly factor BamB
VPPVRRRHWIHLALAAATAPWPQMRLDERNTARSPVPQVASGSARPWEVRTGKGVFNTAVVDRRGVAYIGSADGRVYAIGPRGGVRWTFRTGGIIDAAGLLVGRDLVVGSGDETLYRLRTRRGLPPRRRVVWRFRTPLKPATGQLVNWWEGPLSRHPDGDILAGNTGGGAHKITPEGKLVYVRQAGNSVWTAPATGADGTTYWGSVDRTIFALDPAGAVKWSTQTLGFVTASPAVGGDGTVYSASFDGKVYALDPATGLPKWTFQTRDHIYGGPALSSTGLIVIGSTDGGLYGITPAGTRAWRYDTGDPIRSSPVIGVAADGTEIAYVGSSNGRLYAIDVATGRRRWSFDTTPRRDPVLRDRNDLNGSPSLARDRVIVGGEHGSVWGIPYDHCLRSRDRRCETDPADDVPAQRTRVLPVTAGGNTVDRTLEVPSATTLTGRLIVREDGETVDAAAVAPEVEPGFPASVEQSGDGAFLHIAPEGFLEPSTTYEVGASGTWTADGVPVGNAVVGGTRTGSFADRLRFRTAPLRRGPALRVARRRTRAFVLRRLAVPLPPLLPSVNQIGFDSYDLIAGLVDAGPARADGERRVLLWVIAGRRTPRGRLVPDPAGGFAFPLAGRMRGDQFILRRDGLTLRFSFGDVPVRRFELRGALDRRGGSRPGTSLYAEVTCNEVPNYGPLLAITGICNAGGTLVAQGTFLVAPYGHARRPPGVRVTSVALERPTPTRDGRVTATLAGRLARARHAASVLLTDAGGAPVGLDYLDGTTVRAGAGGDIREVEVRIPAGTELPADLRATVMTDAFPLHRRAL